MYQYGPEAYRQLHEQKMAQVRSDFQRPQTQSRSKAAERCARFVRSVRPRRKLVTIGFLVAALAVPAGAVGKSIRPRHMGVQVACPQVFPGRPYGMCGGKIWVRDPETGKFKSIRFWELQHLNDPPNEDRP